MFAMIAPGDPYRSMPTPKTEWTDEMVTIPYDGQSRMRLLLTSGASNVIFRIDPSATALVEGRFDGLVPTVTVSAGEVRIRYRFGFQEWFAAMFNHPQAEIILHPLVAWDLCFRGGASELDADLRHGLVAGVTIAGGTSDLQLALPEPLTAVPLRIHGGASDVNITRPKAVPFGVRINGGVSDLELDGRSIGAIGGRTSLESDGWTGATARYELTVAGGVSDIAIHGI